MRLVTRGGCFLLAVSLVVGCLLSETRAVEPQNSSWNTVYTLADGTQIGARLSFNGAQGQYTTSAGAKGKLSNVNYGENGSITGDWEFQGGGEGTFELYVKGEAFYGLWTQGEGVHPWGGTLVGASTLKWVGVPGAG